MTAKITMMGVKGGPAIRPGSHMPTSNLVQMGGRTILVDAGLGATRGLCDAGVALTEIDLVLITHLHSDHYLELGPLLHTAWVAGLNRPLPIIGPAGLFPYWEGFLHAMAFDVTLRMEDEGRVPLGPLFQLTPIAEGLVHDGGGLSIHAMRNVHPPIKDSFALRFDSAGKSIAVSGDTAYMPEMAEFAAGADILVHEAMLLDGVEALLARMTNGDDRLRTHILRSHTSAEDVGRIAADAGVGQLALTHMVPDGDPDFTEAHWSAEVRKHWTGPLHIGRDGMVLTA
ncbi:MAG: MBL fold metallo-hydrolase [Alphaproteobacteria bacterium]|jgi:ribonuclease BN (tRNA processing enzyme)|nr:MBL fold metallo-hydrolase [Alphaproteobacteria bacterium]